VGLKSQVSGVRAGSAGDFDEVSRNNVTGLESSGYSLVHRNAESVASQWEYVVLFFCSLGRSVERLSRAGGRAIAGHGRIQERGRALRWCWVGLSRAVVACRYDCMRVVHLA
jgi:hypothetical protein